MKLIEHKVINGLSCIKLLPYLFIIYAMLPRNTRELNRSSVYLNFLHIVQERGAADFVLTLDKAFPENSLERDAS